jgi:hypothetical protein
MRCYMKMMALRPRGRNVSGYWELIKRRRGLSGRYCRRLWRPFLSRFKSGVRIVSILVCKVLGSSGKERLRL